MKKRTVTRAPRETSADEAKAAVLASANVLACAIDFFGAVEKGVPATKAAKRAWERAKKRTKAVAEVEGEFTRRERWEM